MKYFVEFDIKAGWWRIYDLSQRVGEGSLAPCVAMYSTELFDEHIDEMVKHSEEANR